MDFNTIFAGVNVTLLLMIVSGTELLKGLVPLKNKKWYIVVSLSLSVLFTLLGDGLSDLRALTFDSISNFLLAKIFYDAIIQWIEQKKAELKGSL